MKTKTFLFILVLSLIVPISFAADEYKPYLHKATVPEHPEVRLFGQYSTNLFPGAATYSYAIEVPKGVNGLQPSVVISYNSQAIKQRPGILGAGWSLTPNYVYRDVNGTTNNASDDEFLLILNGVPYQLIYNTEDEWWHTEVEYYFKIENISNYWLLTKKDGTQYMFGYDDDSRLESNNGKDYDLKWSLDLVQDTHGNKIYYSYLEDPFEEDNGTVYLDKIEYNNDLQRKIEFTYESSARPDRRFIFEQGNKLDESRRLTDISVYADDSLIRRVHVDYVILNPALSSISKISYYGSDNNSVWYNISFDYYDSAPGYANATSSWQPPVIFSDTSHVDYGVRLVDVNNDGFIDIVKGRQSTSEKKVWINNKQNNWTEDSSWIFPEYITDSSNNQMGVMFADVNKDGFVDLLKARQSETRKVYLNNGTGWNLSSWNIPVDFFENTGVTDQGVRLADANGDGFVDILQARHSLANKVWINNGTGWVEDSNWKIPTKFYDNADAGTRLADINGDGLVDIIRSSENYGIIGAWLNNGTGWVEDYNSTWKVPVYFTKSDNADAGTRLADINGDGLVDLVVDFANSSTTERGAWINNGSGWVQNDSWKSPEAFTKDGYNVGRRLADINGDGFVDIVVSHQDSSTQYSWIKNDTIPYMLKSVVNEYGGITSINYTTSTQFNNSEDGTSDIGFNIFVVSNVSSDSAMNTTSLFDVIGSTSYNYSFGKYNYEDSEFRGFGKAVEKTSSKIINHYFYQDNPRRGKEFKTEIYDLEGNIYTKNIKDYNYTYNNDLYNVSLAYSSSYLYDGVADAKVTNKTFTYDSLGNPEQIVDYGDVSVSGDEKYTEYTYAQNAGNWIVNKVASVILKNANNENVKKTMFYYDSFGLNGMGSLGELTKSERWNNHGNNSFNYFEYDSFGNVIKQTDSFGNSVSYSYDETHTYPDSITNALGHSATFDYDLGTGNLNWEEKNDIRKEFEYDSFGRISKEIMPYDTSSSPTKSYSYDFDGTAPESIEVSLKTTSNKTNDVVYYYDGMANLIQLKIDVEDNQQIVKSIFYDSEFRVDSEQNPYFADYSDSVTGISNTSNKTSYTYDTLSRVIGVFNPDGTSKNVTFEKYNITDFDENGNKHKYELDGHGRIVAVYEYNVDDVGRNETYITNYEYDTSNNLIKITDNEANEFSFTYDTLSRKIGMDDPDLGSWSYVYDKNNNLIRQTDARGEVITLSYDTLNRVTRKAFNDNTTSYNVTFEYDKDFYGTLSNMTFGNGSLTYKYEYDNRLRVIKAIKDYDGVSLEEEFIYDSQDRVISKDREGQDRDYILNKQGMIRQIPEIVTDANYNAFGSILNKTYVNNLVTTYTYNSENNRLTNIAVPSVQDLTYTYDSVGNILSINDAIQNRQHSLTYDNLDRLTEALIGSDRYVYSFNSIGNMMKIVKNNDSKKFVYQGSQAHFPSRIIEGEAGVDVYNPIELDTGNKNRTFEFFLVNDKNTSISGVNFSLDFGNGQSFSNESMTIDDNVMVIVQNNYSRGGDYSVNFSAFSAGTEDNQLFDIKFGTRAEKLERIYSNVSEQYFEFVVNNDISEMVENVSWNCSDGITSIYITNLTGGQSLYDYIANNYTSAGEKTFTCTATSLDGEESQSVSFTVKGLDIENYDILTTDVSKRVVSYDVVNYYTSAETNISMSAETDSFSQIANLDSNENVMVFAEVNYSSDGTKSFDIEVKSNDYSVNYTETFSTEGVTIENYDRTAKNYTISIISFDVRNSWYEGDVNWSITNPDISNTTNLENNETLMVIVENDNLEQGNTRTEITSKVSTFVDQIKNAFEIKPLKIFSLLTLSEGTNSVSEIVVKNNLDGTQQFNWLFGTGIENVSSNELINISSDDVFVYIESNYSNDGVYKTTITVNSTSYNDTEKGVVVV